MAGEEGVKLETEVRGGGRVARVTIDRPSRLNALDSVRIHGLTSAFRSLSNDDDLRAVVLTGAGDRAFIAGADVREMEALDPRAAMAFITRLHEACAAIRACPVPVIARVRGHCLGAGLEVAVSCDLRVASEDALFGMPEVRLGVPSVIEAALLPTLIGWGKTRELVFTGDPIDAAAARAAGLVEAVVPPSELDATVDRWVAGIVVSGRRAVRAQKALIARWEQLPIPDAIEAGIAAFGAAFESNEPRSMMRAWVNRGGSPAD